MKITLIAAMDRNGLIGSNNQLPWHLPADLKHFKQLTFGKPILMGRKTFESIGKPLPERRNLVLTTDKNLVIAGCDIVNSLDAALSLVSNCPEIMIIGGRTIYELAMPVATHMELTLINDTFDGDTHFPKWDKAEWSLIQRDPQHTDEGLQYEFARYQRLQHFP